MVKKSFKDTMNNRGNYGNGNRINNREDIGFTDYEDLSDKDDKERD